MSFDYPSLAATAVSLLTDFGQDVTFTSKTEGAYNKSTGQYGTTSANYTKKAAVTGYKSNEFNDIIQQGDLKVIAESYTYALGDTVAIDSEDYRILDIKQIKPAGTEVAVVLQVRK